MATDGKKSEVSRSAATGSERESLQRLIDLAVWHSATFDPFLLDSRYLDSGRQRVRVPGAEPRDAEIPEQLPSYRAASMARQERQ
jgi:hypothetical protein